MRRLSLRFFPQETPLPTIDELRHLLASDPYIRAVGEKRPETIKRLPLRIINSTIDTTYYYLGTVVRGSPGPATDDILRRLRLRSQMLTEHLLPLVRPTQQTQQSDSAFRLLEHFESLVVEDTIRAIVARHPTQSMVWLHDGFLIYPPPPLELLRHVEEAVLAKHRIPSGPGWFKLESLTEQYHRYEEHLKTVPPATTLSLARRKPFHNPQANRRAMQMQGSVQAWMSPLEALSKLRARRDESWRKV